MRKFALAILIVLFFVVCSSPYLLLDQIPTDTYYTIVKIDTIKAPDGAVLYKVYYK
jgi:hypothetical protein